MLLNMLKGCFVNNIFINALRTSYFKFWIDSWPSHTHPKSSLPPYQPKFMLKCHNTDEKWNFLSYKGPSANKCFFMLEKKSVTLAYPDLMQAVKTNVSSHYINNKIHCWSPWNPTYVWLTVLPTSSTYRINPDF